MKLKKYILTTIGIALVFNGCASNQYERKTYERNQPKFNPNNKGIVFVEGKPYRIPSGSKYGLTRLTSSDPQYKELKSYGVNCRNGDIYWIETNTFNAIANANQNRQNAKFIAFQAAKSGYTGCAHPLSNQEYQYYLNQQNQNAANSRAMMQQMVAMQQQQASQQAMRDQEYYNNINNSANQQIQQRNNEWFRDNYILNRVGY